MQQLGMIGLGRMGANMVHRLTRADQQCVVYDVLVPLLSPGDIVIDGGNSHYEDDIRRGRDLKARGIRYIDVGTGGGVMGMERGYCLMIGGGKAIVEHLTPIFAALAPGAAQDSSRDGQQVNKSPAEQGYFHCGAQGAGHFVKMVHNGIEYGVMAAYTEGLNILRGANIGKRRQQKVDAETTPPRNSVPHSSGGSSLAVMPIMPTGFCRR
jgi:6-phosphogluconate dehydrogenase